ncbi:MAG: SDR family oxidoreductase [Firmicutes bacterium]|jgi:NAD(P)-dependent dehydrogenase (short-subunit alcohol dehydrogenase family)|nr:SDR family oxidoreductase [Bacillota bacterium]
MTKNNGPVALVTGAGRGIGRAIAERLSENGYQIALHYWAAPDQAVEWVEAVLKQGKHARLFTGDLTVEDTPTKLVAEVLAAYGRLDVVVNNAGQTLSAPFLEMSADQLETLYRLLFLAPYRISQVAAQWMVRHSVHGCLVQIASVHHNRVTDQDSAYGAMRAAAIRAMQSMAYELAPYGIRANAVAPGRILTQFLSQGADPLRLQEIDAVMPLRRSGTPEDIANAVEWLVSPQASYVTGMTLTIDGGFNLSMPSPMIGGKPTFI